MPSIFKKKKAPPGKNLPEQEAIQALKEGMASFERGEGRPAKEALDE